MRVESFGGGYTHFPMQQGFARRMAEVLPHGKLICMVRDPVERMLSRCIHNVCECLETSAPAEVFAGEPLRNPYVSESLYYTQLDQFRQFFADDRFFAIEYDDFRHRRRATLRSVFRFLGVDETFWSPAFDVVRHPTAGKRRKTDFGATLHLRFGRHLLSATTCSARKWNSSRRLPVGVSRTGSRIRARSEPRIGAQAVARCPGRGGRFENCRTSPDHNSAFSSSVI